MSSLSATASVDNSNLSVQAALPPDSKSTGGAAASFYGARMDMGDESESDAEDDLSEEEVAIIEELTDDDESMNAYHSDGNERTSVEQSTSNSPATSVSGDPIASNRPSSITPGTSPVPRSRFGLAMALMSRAVRRGDVGTSTNSAGSSPPQTPSSGGGGAVSNGSSGPNDASGGNGADSPALPRPKLSLRLQKFVATRLSDSSAGQLFIRGFLGPRGQAVVEATGVIMVKHSGKSTGGQMRRLMYKLASKFLVFEQNKALTEEMRSAIRQPMLVLCFHLMNLLKMAKQDVTMVESAQISGIKLFISDLHEALKKACASILNAHNLDYLNAVFAYLMSEPFLEYCFESPEAEHERNVVLTNLSLDYKDIESEILSINRCTSVQLRRRRDVLRTLTERPSIRALVRSAETATIIIQWATKMATSDGVDDLHDRNDAGLQSERSSKGSQRSDELIDNRGSGDLLGTRFSEIDFKSVLNGLKFLIAAEYYGTIVSRELAGTKALVIFDRFLGPTTATAPVNVRPEILAEIGFQIDSEAYPQSLFERAREAEVKRLESLNVLEAFMSSKEFRRLRFELDMLDRHLQAFIDLSGNEGPLGGAGENEFGGLAASHVRDSMWTR